MPNINEQQFCLTVDYDKTSAHPEEVFLGIAHLIKTFNNLDSSLVTCIDNKIEPIIILEDVEKGSIKMLFKNIIESLPDDGLKECNVKKILGSYLVKAKYLILSHISDKDTIDIKDIEFLENHIATMAKKTNISQLDCYSPPPRADFLKNISFIGESVATFRKNDHIYMEIPGKQKITINSNFRLPQNNIEELCAGDKITNTYDMILKVRKPDFLGNTQWIFRHGNNNFDAKILDLEWLDNYRHRKIAVFPGDSLKVTIESTCVYDNNGELLNSKNSIIKVLTVLPGDINDLAQGQITTF